jgi:hypothetical protein
MAGEGGTKAGGVPIQPRINKPGQRDAQPPVGAGHWPPLEAPVQSPALWAGIFTSSNVCKSRHNALSDDTYAFARRHFNSQTPGRYGITGSRIAQPTGRRVHLVSRGTPGKTRQRTMSPDNLYGVLTWSAKMGGA